MELMYDELVHQSEPYNIKLINFAHSGEKLYTNCLRVGALPGNVKFNSNKLEINAKNYLTTDWPLDLAMQPFEMSINNINGSLHIDNNGYYFKPSPDTQIINLELDIFHPITSKFVADENSIFILNLGKNDLLSNNDHQLPAQLKSCINYISTNYTSKIYLINHFTTINADQSLIERIQKINLYMKNQLAYQYFDLNKYINSKDIWSDSKITPNQQDIENQANYKLAPSLSRDSIHLNDKTNIHIVNKIYEDLTELKWIK